jgi:hypothetical protein
MDESKTDVTRDQENIHREIQDYLYNNPNQEEKSESKTQKELSNEILYFSINQDSK